MARIRSTFTVGRAVLLSVLAVLVFSSSGLFASGIYVKGTVVSRSNDRPIANALVSLAGLVHDTTDTNGSFLLVSDSLSIVGTSRGRLRENTSGIQFTDSRIVLRNVRGRRVSVTVHTILGRNRVLVPEYTAITDHISITLTPRLGLPPGVYIFQIKSGNDVTQAYCTVAGNRHVWRRPDVPTSPARTGLGRQQASSLPVTAFAVGFCMDSATVTQDTVLDLKISLRDLPDSVEISRDSQTVAFLVPTLTATGGGRYTWALGSTIRSYLSLAENLGTTVRTFNRISFDNGLIRVEISPDLGMRVLKVMDRTAMPGRQMFALFEDPANPVAFAQNYGGIKPSYPYHENSTGMIDEEGNLSYRAGYFTEKLAGGAVRIVMNMRFDYQQKEMDAGFTGKYGDGPLTCMVEIKPQCNDVSVTYVADNPNPLRRSNRIWTDALYPDLGPSDSWIFPTKYAVDHFCNSVVYDIQTTGITQTRTGSFFALYSPYPFAGAYYGAAHANHLRVTPDPVAYPGVKIYDKFPKELWGSTHAHFEAPEEKFADAFEPCYLEHSYYMTRSIGKATYANRSVAISEKDGTFRLTAPAPLTVTVYDYDKASDPIISNGRIGPQSVLSGSFTTGLRVVSEGRELCNVKLPLVYEDNRGRFDDLARSASLSGCAGLSPLNARQGIHYEVENVAAKTNLLSSLAVLLAARNVTAADDPDVLVSMANTAYRHGGFGAVDTILTALGDRRPAESRYLRALMALERDQPADFDETVIEGRYFKALSFIREDDSLAAIAQLDTLLATRPRAIRPLLLRSWLTRDTADAMAAYRLNPGSVELWTTLRELGVTGAEAVLAGLLNQNAMARTRSDDFVKELTTGIWRHERRFEYDRAWFDRVSMPAFPEELKYDTSNP